MAKGGSNNARYKYPLPIHPLDDLPDLIPHNPISWVYWIFKYAVSVNSLEKKILVTIKGDRYGHILVSDPINMKYLWENGFFGTGQYSRSEPTWKNRAETRLLEDSESKSGSNNIKLEEVTKRRRILRLQFKKKREELEQQLLNLRKQGGSIEEERKILETEREVLRKFRDEQSIIDNSDSSFAQAARIEDAQLVNDDGTIINLESLELLPVEAIFLTFALPVLDMNISTLMNTLIRQRSDTLHYQDIHQLIKKYVVYHHYRSRGWCVRSGIKFACDYLLYKRGPPFQHANFCVLSLDAQESQDYTWYSSIARVTGGARKTLVLCYVTRLEPEEYILDCWKNNKFTEIFSSYKIGEVIYKRWLPGKNRD